MIKDNIDILLISETKIDSSFPTVQFHRDGYTIHRRGRNENGGGLLLYVREDVPSTLLKTDSEIEAFYVELNVRKRSGYYVAHIIQIKILLRITLLKLVRIMICFHQNMRTSFY